MIQEYIDSVRAARPRIQTPCSYLIEGYDAFKAGADLLCNTDYLLDPTTAIVSGAMSGLLHGRDGAYITVVIAAGQAEDNIEFRGYEPPREEERGGIVLPRRFIHLAREEPIQALGAVVCTVEDVRTVCTEPGSIRAIAQDVDAVQAWQEQGSIRSNALVAGVLHALVAMAYEEGIGRQLDEMIGPPQRELMGQYPKGFGSLPANATRFSIGGQPMPSLGGTQVEGMMSLEACLALPGESGRRKVVDTLRGILTSGLLLPAQIEEVWRATDSAAHIHPESTTATNNGNSLVLGFISGLPGPQHESCSCSHSKDSCQENIERLRALKPEDISQIVVR